VATSVWEKNTMKILIVADPLESFKTHKDTTFAMVREAVMRGHTVLACEAQHLSWESGEGVRALVRNISLTEPPLHPLPQAAEGAGNAHAPALAPSPWFTSPAPQPVRLCDVDAVLMRTDPPFDSEYFYATHLLTQAEREGARVFNAPQALREHPEKLAILEFPQFISPTLVTRSEAQIKRFHAAHHDIILKPLDGMGGMGIFRVGPDGLNLGSICETLNRSSTQSVMVQRYLQEISRGDKRVLLIGGKPVPYALARIPQGSEIRGNMAVGGKGVAQPLSARDLEIANHLGPTLAARGLLLVGLDIIGSCLTEINVTSPTGFQEIMQQTGVNVAALFVDALEDALGNEAATP
jgi:glutathione synthase